MTDRNPRSLSDLKFLDFSTTIAGPHCARLLADMGADVIKVESPEGDLMRNRPVLREGSTAGTMFGQLNAGKRSIVLDLKKPEAIAAVKKLVSGVDIVVENYRPGVMKRLGLDYPELAKVNPRLIYCAISGYGQTGPAAGRPAYAPVIHAASGYDLAHMAYQGGERRPDYCGIYIADVLTGKFNPVGKLPVTWPRHGGQVPIFYGQRPSGRPPRAGGARCGSPPRGCLCSWHRAPAGCRSRRRATLPDSRPRAGPPPCAR